MMKQKGFTLLELLIVVTVLGVLAAGALVAYDGIGESSKGTADANNIATIDGAIRTYRVVESNYPNQYDSLIDDTGAVIAAMSSDLQGVLGVWNQANTSGVGSAVSDAMAAVGISRLQVVQSAGNTVLAMKAVPGGINMAHNEGAAGANAAETAIAGTTDWAVVVSSNGAACTAAGGTFDTTFSGTTVTNSTILNRINDSFEDDECNLVLAVGFGNDAASSTTNSTAAIAAAGASGAVDGDTYGRYIALFHVGEDDNGDGDLDDTGEIHTKPRFIGLISPKGQTVTQALNTAKGN